MRFPRARGAIAVAALAAFALLAVLYDRHLHHRMLHTGDTLVPLAVAKLDGSPFSIAPAGRATVINVFATWCGPCREETPAFSATARELQRRGVTVIGIDQQEGAAAVTEFVREYSLTYPIYIDERMVTHYLLGARVIPSTFYVDSRGIIRREYQGPMTRAQLLDLVRSAA